MVLRKVNRKEYGEWEGRAWNAFVDLVATGDPTCFTDIQLRAYLVFWYDAEVANGGHLQYFVNHCPEQVVATLQALNDLKMPYHQIVLLDAFEFVKLNPIKNIETVEEYVAEELEDKFGQFDADFYECEPQPFEVLKSYLAEHFDEFIELTDGDADRLSIDI